MKGDIHSDIHTYIVIFRKQVPVHEHMYMFVYICVLLYVYTFILSFVSVSREVHVYRPWFDLLT